MATPKHRQHRTQNMIAKRYLHLARGKPLWEEGRPSGNIKDPDRSDVRVSEGSKSLQGVVGNDMPVSTASSKAHTHRNGLCTQVQPYQNRSNAIAVCLSLSNKTCFRLSSLCCCCCCCVLSACTTERQTNGYTLIPPPARATNELLLPHLPVFFSSL